MDKSRIRHSVVFTLKHPQGSEAERQFIADGQRLLSAIPSVIGFEALRQVSPKNTYQWGFSMEFASQEGYEEYNNHPVHQAFVQSRWQTEVVDFMEIDYVAFAE